MVEIIDEPYFQGDNAQFTFHRPNLTKESVLIEEKNNTRVLTFNAARTVKQMIQLEHTLEEWEKDDVVELVILKTDQENLSAKGDDQRTCQFVDSVKMGREGFYRTYWLTYHLATYKKPIIALWNGVFLGTSLGLPMMCMYSIATEKAMYSMSEAGLGFHTDIGASYFLPRLPGYLGEYLGLTGASLNGAELLACGFATHFVPSKSLWKLENLLLALDTGESDVLRSTLDELSIVVEPPECSVLNRLDVIDRCFSKNSVEEIMEAIVLEKANGSDWLQNVYKSLQRSSPTGLKQTLRSIREGRNKTLFGCIRQEYRLTVNALRSTISTDLWEAVRATTINKDKTPKWKPATLAEVTEDKVYTVFQTLGLDEIQLPLEGVLPRWSGKFQSMIHHRL
ncbi:hypothetical protein O6H91_21G067800 [Diphasiastrum complanatum]|uniref:Uncharacterized protein n=1 Tax=Diphasiastrum complanatum TaxID=34168 RepID=A0ACC2ALP1_DIPCM|nr:hypothetical protein O6H91_21G067800 [Diphasiastrum complanatum]